MNNEDVLRFFDLYSDDAFRLAYSYLGSSLLTARASPTTALCMILRTSSSFATSKKAAE
ncbi:MAG: hypothetical protein IKO15_05105 [Clostridiales bacterium]|nr:hypothetical protein [Clostridiales bacterium]